MPWTRMCGHALTAGGVLIAAVNAILTPLVPFAEGDAIARSSTAYLVRLSLAEAAALLLLLGCFGAWALPGRATLFRRVAFLVAFAGNAGLVAAEFANLFLLRPLAQENPEALAALDASPLYIGGFTAAVSAFGLGWILLAIAALLAPGFDRRPPGLTLAGLLLTTALTPLGVAGAIVGSLVFGAGLAWFGRAVVARADG